MSLAINNVVSRDRCVSCNGCHVPSSARSRAKLVLRRLRRRASPAERWRRHQRSAVGGLLCRGRSCDVQQHTRQRGTSDDFRSLQEPMSQSSRIARGGAQTPAHGFGPRFNGSPWSLARFSNRHRRWQSPRAQESLRRVIWCLECQMAVRCQVRRLPEKACQLLHSEFLQLALHTQLAL